MDLLGGYGSEGSSSNASSTSIPVESKEKSKQYAAAPAPIKSIPATPSIARSKQQRRGKKLVSLHAILPVHIVDQLTQGVEYGSSSDDDDGNRVAPPATMSAKQVQHQDSGISSFLSELHSVPTTANLSRETKSIGSIQHKSDPLGSAFLSTVVTRQSSSTEVMDIHGTPITPSVETVDEDSDEQEHIPEKPQGTTTTIRTTQVAPNRASVPRPMAAPRIAAPRHASPLANPIEPSICDIQPSIEERPAIVENRPSLLDKKQSRKDMERALRSGNFSNLSGNVHILDGHNSNSYIAPADSNNGAPRHNVKVAPVRMYDTKAGTDVMGANVSGKAKGKNQVNHLMAAAAAFELKESQGAFKPKSQKANAKRKYGW